MQADWNKQADLGIAAAAGHGDGVDILEQVLAVRSPGEVNSVEASWLMYTSVARYVRLELASGTVCAAVIQQELGHTVDWPLAEEAAC